MEDSKEQLTLLQTSVPETTARLVKIAATIEGLSVKDYLATIVEKEVRNNEVLKAIKLG